ncbi:MAG TPA: DUF4186 domain-containing protein [Pirellulales bacterium]|nr:DUF4186 domain-containing protein [Pirellulales bacterium]
MTNPAGQISPDIEQRLDALARSSFRRRFQLDAQHRAYLNQVGLAAILEHGRRFVLQRLAPAAPPDDGRQTPWRGHPVFVAQHATATCCRRCLSKWHHAARGSALSEAQVDDVLKLVGGWLDRQGAGSAAAPERQKTLPFFFPEA